MVNLSEYKIISFNVSTLCKNFSVSRKEQEFKILGHVTIEVLSESKKNVKVLIESVWNSPEIESIYDSRTLSLKKEFNSEKEIFMKAFVFAYGKSDINLIFIDFPNMIIPGRFDFDCCCFDSRRLVIVRLLNEYVKAEITQNNTLQANLSTAILTTELSHKNASERDSKKRAFKAKQKELDREAMANNCGGGGDGSHELAMAIANPRQWNRSYKH